MPINDDVSTFLKAFTKPPQIKVLSMLAGKQEQEFTKTDIANKSGIGRTTLYRIWDDLERMRAIKPSRKVGAITLYRLNAESPIVQSLLSIRERLQRIETAVRKIEEIGTLERQARTGFGEGMPLGPAFLLKLHDLKALSLATAVPLSEVEIDSPQEVPIQALLKAGLIDESEEKYLLTPLGILTAEGASEVWRGSERQTISETMSSLKVALDTVSKDIKDLRKELTT